MQDSFSTQDTLYLDLLDIKLVDDLMLDKSRFERLINAPESKAKRVVIDEVQKLPSLLNVVLSRDPLEFLFGKTRAMQWQGGIDVLFDS